MSRIADEKGAYSGGKPAASRINAVVWALLITLGTLITAQVVTPASTGQLATTSELPRGEIRGIDMQAGTVTLRPLPTPYLDTAALHRAYPVRDPAILNKVKVGDTVRFMVWDVRGKPTLGRLQRDR